MKIKGNCFDCKRKYQYNKLRESEFDHRKICYNCYIKECRSNENAELSSMDKDNYLMYKSTKKQKISSRAMNLIKNGVYLIRGEEKYWRRRMISVNCWCLWIIAIIFFIFSIIYGQLNKNKIDEKVKRYKSLMIIKA